VGDWFSGGNGGREGCWRLAEKGTLLLQHSVPDRSVCLRAESVWDSYRRASLLALFHGILLVCFATYVVLPVGSLFAPLPIVSLACMRHKSPHMIRPVSS
jgi:hypothetical protein